MKYNNFLCVMVILAGLFVLPGISTAGPCSAGKESSTGSKASAATAAGAVAAAKAARALEADVNALSNMSEGCADNDNCRRNSLDLLKRINTQADQVEAQVVLLADKIDSVSITNKLDQLKKYVQELRLKTEKITNNIL